MSTDVSTKHGAAARRVRSGLLEQLNHATAEAREHATQAALNFARYPEDATARGEAVRLVREADELEQFRRYAVEALSVAVRRIESPQKEAAAGDSTVTATVTDGEP